MGELEKSLLKICRTGPETPSTKPLFGGRVLGSMVLLEPSGFCFGTACYFLEIREDEGPFFFFFAFASYNDPLPLSSAPISLLCFFLLSFATAWVPDHHPCRRRYIFL
jgi:hypothetical protein